MTINGTIPEKNPNRGGSGYTFLKTSTGIFRFVTLPLEIPEKIIFHPSKFCKIVWHPLEIPGSKNETHGNSKWFFLEHPWKFYFFFNRPLEFPHAFSSIPLKIQCPQPLCLDCILFTQEYLCPIWFTGIHHRWLQTYFSFITLCGWGKLSWTT